MTYKKFEELVKRFVLNVAEVSKHVYGFSDSITNVSIRFNGSNKYYLYKGTYLQVLNSLGAQIISEEEITALKESIRQAYELVGYSLFKSIAEQEAEAFSKEAKIRNYARKLKGCYIIAKNGDVVGQFNGIL